MADNFDSFNTQDFLQQVIHAVVSNAPLHSGTVINYVIDTVFFVKTKEDKAKALWNSLEENISKLTKQQVDDAVDRALGQMAATSLLNKVKNFGTQFRQLAYLHGVDQQKMHLALLTNEATHLIAEVTNVPGTYLHSLARHFQVIAGCHIAAIFQLKKYEPEVYRHQSTLNNMAILYSDTAGKMFERSMAWRRAMIAEGKGALYQMDWSPEKDPGPLKPKQKRVQFEAYDKFYNGIFQPGKGIPVVNIFTPDIPADHPSPEYGATEMEAYRKLGEYDAKVQGEWTAYWNKLLLDATNGFMQLVDWPGVEREKKGEIGSPANHFAYPITPSRSTLHDADLLRRIDIFLEQQMDHFAISGPRYAQTYRQAAPIVYGASDKLFLRADSYDSAVACIYFLERGNLARAQDLGDALVQAMNHDPKGEGRIVAATIVDRLIEKDQNMQTSIFFPDGGRRDIGNMSWAGIALTRLFVHTKLYRYLHAAETIGQWILTNCTTNDSWQGFSGGEDHWGNKEKWRSVEHNVDCCAFFNNLFFLTQRKEWETARESARTLVKACKISPGFYCTGTGLTQVLNNSVVPTDTQSWTTLANIEPSANKISLDYMIDVMQTESAGFKGTKFAQAGSGVQNEATAGAAMALWMARDAGRRFKETAEAYLNSLKRQQSEAKNATGYGIVATPVEFADTGAGLGWKYFNYQHVASSAWTGLAFLFKDDKPTANPYAPLDLIKNNG